MMFLPVLMQTFPEGAEHRQNENRILWHPELILLPYRPEIFLSWFPERPLQHRLYRGQQHYLWNGGL